MSKALIIMIGMFLTGCGIYKTEFQCRPGKGVGCAPVGEVLDMIIESEDGEDQFVIDKEQAERLRQNVEHPLSLSRPRLKPSLKPKTLMLTQGPDGELILSEKEAL